MIRTESIQQQARELEGVQRAEHRDVFARQASYRSHIYAGLDVTNPRWDLVFTPELFGQNRLVILPGEKGERDVVSAHSPRIPDTDMYTQLTRATEAATGSFVSHETNYKPDLRALMQVLADTAAKGAIRLGKTTPNHIQVAEGIWGQWAVNTLQGIQHASAGGHSRESEMSSMFQDELAAMLENPETPLTSQDPQFWETSNVIRLEESVLARTEEMLGPANYLAFERVRRSMLDAGALHNDHLTLSGEPYPVHLFQGMGLILDHPYFQNAPSDMVATHLAIFAFHDAAEDRDLNPNVLGHAYGHDVMTGVIALSKQIPAWGQFRTDEQYTADLQNESESIRILKGIDRLVNLRMLPRIQRVFRENDEFIRGQGREYLERTTTDILPLVAFDPYTYDQVAKATSELAALYE